jgi:DNA primase
MSLFEYVKANISIVEVISQGIALKKIGSYWKGSCPFHSEKDASFTVSPDKGIFYCFGCHASGDVIAFIAKLENVSQFEAAQILVERHGLTIPDDIAQKQKHGNYSYESKNQHYRVHEIIAHWAHDELLKRNKVFDYIVSRGITENTLKRFMVGYFPRGVNNIQRFIKYANQKNIILQDIFDVGFLIDKKGSLFSFFEERVLFPIKDHLGHFCAFGGRVFQPGDDRAKYYNSKESSFFVKGKILFGFDSAKAVMQQKKKAFLVEGYLDCVAMVQHGYENTVATLGTACTLDHLSLLSRSVDTLYVMYDGDIAGKKAILRITRLCWQVNITVDILELPKNTDPASFLMAGGDVSNLCSNAKDIFSFFIETSCSDFSQKTFAQKIGVAQKIVGLIRLVNDPFKRDLLLQEASFSMNIAPEIIRELMKKEDSRQVIDTEKMQKENSKAYFLLEEKIFFVIINSMKSLEDIAQYDGVLEYLSDAIRPLFNKLFLYIKQEAGRRSFDGFISSLEEQEKNKVIRLSMQFEKKISQDALQQLIFQLYRFHWKNLVHNVKNDIVQAKKSGNTEMLHGLLATLSSLREKIVK